MIFTFPAGFIQFGRCPDGVVRPVATQVCSYLGIQMIQNYRMRAAGNKPELRCSLPLKGKKTARRTNSYRMLDMPELLGLLRDSKLPAAARFIELYDEASAKAALGLPHDTVRVVFEDAPEDLYVQPSQETATVAAVECDNLPTA